jgi:hypothetical protein
MLPVFDSYGNLVGYQPQPCPPQYVVCCRGMINIAGYCISENNFLSIKLNFPSSPSEPSIVIRRMIYPNHSLWTNEPSFQNHIQP